MVTLGSLQSQNRVAQTQVMGWPKALRHLHRTGKMPRMSYRISGSIWRLVGYPQHLYDGKHLLLGN